MLRRISVVNSLGGLLWALTVLATSAAAFASPRAGGSWGVAIAPADASSPRPPIVFLHGMWASPEEQCAVFERAATEFGFLVCPRGNTPFADGYMWTGTYADAERQIAPALAAAEALAPGKMDRGRDGTLIGYSNGAYFAAEVAYAEPGRWSGLILLSMKLHLDAARLRAAGVRRVLLAAGDQDSVHESMQQTAEELEAGGLEARFMSLGPGGHPFPPDMAHRMVEAIRWARGRTHSE
jgi:predicted esterase